MSKSNPLTLVVVFTLSMMLIGCASDKKKMQDDAAAGEKAMQNERMDHPGGPPAFTDAIHALLTDHEKIMREVTDIPNGIEAVTTSDDPEVAALIRKHVKEMSERLESGQPVRRWDPLFRELFVHYKKIQLEVTEVDGGVKVRETSDDPSVVLLIRQHAHKGVSEFVRDGFARAHETSPLPDGYVVAEETDEADTSQVGMGRGHGPGMGHGRGHGRGQGRGMGWGRQRQQQQDTSPDDESNESTTDSPAS